MRTREEEKELLQSKHCFSKFDWDWITITVFLCCGLCCDDRIWSSNWIVTAIRILLGVAFFAGLVFCLVKRNACRKQQVAQKH